MIHFPIRIFVGLCLSVTLAITFSACGKKSASAVTSKHGDVFKSASPEVKAGWDGAMAAMKTNGYAAAMLALQVARSQPGVTADQGKALDETMTAVSDQMYDAANKDDPAAKQAIEDLRKAQGR